MVKQYSGGDNCPTGGGGTRRKKKASISFTNVELEEKKMSAKKNL